MDYKWNLADEVHHREHGFSDRYNFRNRSSSSFEGSIGGSEYILKNLKPSHSLRFDRASCCDFNRRGNLIGTGCGSILVNIFEWAKQKLICSFQIDDCSWISDLKFINTEGNDLDIILTTGDGTLLHTTISPNGSVTKNCIFKKTRCEAAATAVPGTFNEIIVVDTDGGISLMDLRCQKTQSSYKQDSMKFTAVAHHPFAPEICVGRDYNYLVNIFDTRNLKDCVSEMCCDYGMLPEFQNVRGEEISNCNYNFDGSEIIVKTWDFRCVLFKNYKFKAAMQEHAEFFGPKSEFIVALMDLNVCFYDKNFKTILERNLDQFSYQDSETNPPRVVKAHPFLPLVGLSSWSLIDFLILSTKPESTEQGKYQAW